MSARPALSIREAVKTWLDDGGTQGWSRRTVGDRRQMLEWGAWWLETEEEFPVTLESLSPTIRAFLTYTRDGSPNGRWGSEHHAVKRETGPSTVATYHRQLRALIHFCLAEGPLVASPLQNVKPPRIPADQVQRRNRNRRLKVEATVRAGVVCRLEELVLETEEELTRRCRIRAPEALNSSWKANLPQEE